MVAAGEGMEEQHSVTRIRRQGTIRLIRQLCIGQSFPALKAEFSERKDVTDDGGRHDLSPVRKEAGEIPPTSRTSKKQGKPGSLNPFFAEACAGSGPLASLELGVALADDVERTLALHDLAICVAALHGSE